ncbi:PIM2 kinase, partial [Amia calva]|nr:PIM2 kinase [Amia calva]
VPLEAALHQQVSAAPSCPGVVGLLDSFTEPESCLLVLERPVPCMDLYDFVMQKGGHLDEPMAKDFLRQVVQALQHCHTRGVVHRDLKMENILVESISHRLKLIDFGLASRLRDGFYRDQAGTLEFFAPETVRVGRYRALPATVWSVGVLLYVLLCGSYPFCDGRAIIQGKLSFPSGLSKDCCDLIRSCCNMTAASRPTLEEILLHPWMA